jgi:hypothetical protein
MSRRGTLVLGVFLVLGLGCAAAAPGIDVRAAQLARVPANAEFVAQADLAKVIDAQDVEHWLGWMARLQPEAAPDTSCVTPLLARTTMLTDVMLPGTPQTGEDAVVLLSGEVTAADIAACAAKVMGGPTATPPAPSADGVYTLGDEHDEAMLADLPGVGVVIGTPAGFAAARAAAPAGGPVAANPLMARLRALVPAGGDLEAFLLKAMGSEGISVLGGGIGLTRGTADRYEAVLLAADADAANAISLLVMGLPLLIAQGESQMSMMATAPEAAPVAGEMFAEVQPILAAAREALADAQVTVENDVVRVVFQLDPAKAGPTELLMVGGMMLFGMRAMPAEGPAGPVLSDPVEAPAVVEPPVEESGTAR